MGYVINGAEFNMDERFESLVDIFNYSFKQFPNNKAFTNLGYSLTYNDLEKGSRDFAAYLQSLPNLNPGDRVAVQLPNLLQYPIAAIGVLRAGFVLVNTNPLYTAREMEHQFNDSDVKAVVVLANMATTLQEVLSKTSVEHIVLTEIGDVLPWPKRTIVNTVVKYVKKMVPSFRLPTAVKFNKALKIGAKRQLNEASPQSDDIAVLQYTGGTTGVAKGAMLTHRNLIANMLQCKQSMQGIISEGNEVVIAPLPVYHIYTFTVNALLLCLTGNETVFITNPRDLPSLIKTLEETRFTGFIGLNTLFAALCNNEDFKKLDFSPLQFTISGGMALAKGVAHRWQDVTGCEIIEGYGMTETSPVVSFNPHSDIRLGTVGIPVPGTDVSVIDENGNVLEVGEAGELCCRGPQVMKGYWKRDDATIKAMTKDGWLKTGDVAQLDADGYISIVDRIKDMIIVSGFNVYPNEIEDVISLHDDVLEAAVIGVPNEKSGEAVKLFVVKKNPSLTAEAVIAFARENLTGYKVPKLVEFVDDLPKTAVGKVLRRELKEREKQSS